MKFRTLSIYFVLICVTVGMLVGIRAVQKDLDAQIAEHRLRFTGEIRNAPPLVVFTTVAMGSFRGLVADLLWLRADSLKLKQSYYEMVQLAQWITDLQPTFSGATAFLAWNMAYNISVTCSDFADRWRWVNEGIKLLRDRALEYNPDDPKLYKELAWIFEHKMGNVMDDAQLYYKNRLAVQMDGAFGPHPEWEKMAAAPVGKKAFLVKYPADHRLWTLLAEAGIADYDRLYAAYSASTPYLPAEVNKALAPAPELRDDLLNCLRAEYLRVEFRLDPRKILELNKKDGEMDWRVPESQAIYWATESLLHGGDQRDINTDRMIAHSLYESFKAGKILTVDERKFETMVVIPNLALVDAVYATYTDAQNYHDAENTFLSSFRTARINFTKEAISILYNYGAFSKAEEYYKRLVEDDGPQKKEEGGKVTYYHNLEEFVMAQWVEIITTSNPEQASEIISGLIFRSINYMLYNDQDAAVANERIARYVYNYYVKNIGTSERMVLPPFKEIKRSVVESCMRVFPPGLVNVLKAKIAAEQAEAEAENARSAAENTEKTEKTEK